MTEDRYKAMLASPELDGIGKWILSIVNQMCRKYGKNQEDLLSDAIVCYLENKHKYDETKGTRTTFVNILLRSRLNRRVPECRTEPNRVDMGRIQVATYDKFHVERSDDAQEALTMLGEWDSKGRVRDYFRNKKWPVKRTEAALAELRAEVKADRALSTRRNIFWVTANASA